MEENILWPLLYPGDGSGTITFFVIDYYSKKPGDFSSGEITHRALKTKKI
jgi:hypothetical protein